MKVRMAEQGDVPVFVEMAKLFHANTRFRDYEYSPELVPQHLQAVVDNPQGKYCFFVAVNSKGDPVGGLIACLENHFFPISLWQVLFTMMCCLSFVWVVRD